MKPASEPAIIARHWFVEIAGFDWRFLWMGGCLSWGRMWMAGWRVWLDFGFGSRWRRGYAQTVVT